MASAGRTRGRASVSKARSSISAEPLAGSLARKLKPPASPFARKTLAFLKSEALQSKGTQFKEIIAELERRALKKTSAKAEAILQFLSENCKPAQRKIVFASIENVKAEKEKRTARVEKKPAAVKPVRVDKKQQLVQPPRAVAELKPAVVEPVRVGLARAEPPRVDVSTVSLEGLLAVPVRVQSPSSSASEVRDALAILSKPKGVARPRRFSTPKILLFSALALAAAALAYRAGVIPDFAPTTTTKIERVEKPDSEHLRVLVPFHLLPSKPAAEQPKPPAESQPPALGGNSASLASRPSQPEAGAAPPKPSEKPKDALSQAFDNALQGIDLNDVDLSDLTEAAGVFAGSAFKLKARFDEVKSKIEQLSSKFSDDYIFEMLSQADRAYVFYSLKAAAKTLLKQHSGNSELKEFAESLDDSDAAGLDAFSVYQYSTYFATAARSAGLEWSEVEKRVPTSVYLQDLPSVTVRELQELEAEAQAEAKEEETVSKAEERAPPERVLGGKPPSESDALADKRELLNIYSHVLNAARKIGDIGGYEHAATFSAFAGRLSAFDQSALSLQKAHDILVEYCLLMHATGIDWSDMGGFMPHSDRFQLLNVQALGKAKKQAEAKKTD